MFMIPIQNVIDLLVCHRKDNAYLVLVCSDI